MNELSTSPQRMRIRFEAIGVAPHALAVAPSLSFRVRVSCEGARAVHALVLQVRLRIHAASRAYSESERKRLVPLFGEAKQWAQTTRNPLVWAETSIATGRFEGSTEIELGVPCSWDLALATAKLFDALDGGTLPISLSFSGTLFCDDLDGALVVQPLPSQEDIRFDLAVDTWRAIVEAHHPAGALLRLPRDLADRLRALEPGSASLERTVERLIGDAEQRRSER